MRKIKDFRIPEDSLRFIIREAAEEYLASFLASKIADDVLESMIKYGWEVTEGEEDE